jgi:LDH2 family malate/lactate/ureidoglycolate dehydrogenase
MHRFDSTQLKTIGVKIFVAAGVDESTATELMNSLILSNLMGVDSHGIVRIGQYINALKTGALVPGTQPKITRENEVIVVLDGCKGFGQIVSKKAMRFAIDKARRNGIGVTCFTNVHHVGRLGEFVAMASEENMIGIMFVNGSRPGGLVAPFGARQRMLGTNPLAFSIPAGSYPPLLADFATSTVAEGKVRIAHRRGEKVPVAWLVNKDGKPTDNPSDLYDGGAITTFGDYKGYALSLLIEVLGGILSGGDTPIFPGYNMLNNGVFAIAIEPTFFRPREAYSAAVDYLFMRIKTALPALHSQGALIPGEIEVARRIILEKEGISIDGSTLAELSEIAGSLGISLDLHPIAVSA